METIKMKSIVSSPVHSLSHSLSAFPMGTFKQRWFREVMFILSQNTNTIHIENHPHAIPIYCSFGVLSLPLPLSLSLSPSPSFPLLPICSFASLGVFEWRPDSTIHRLHHPPESHQPSAQSAKVPFPLFSSSPCSLPPLFTFSLYCMLFSFLSHLIFSLLSLLFVLSLLLPPFPGLFTPLLQHSY